MILLKAFSLYFKECQRYIASQEFKEMFFKSRLYAKKKLKLITLIQTNMIVRTLCSFIVLAAYKRITLRKKGVRSIKEKVRPIKRWSHDKVGMTGRLEIY